MDHRIVKLLLKEIILSFTRIDKKLIPEIIAEEFKSYFLHNREYRCHIGKDCGSCSNYIYQLFSSGRI
jgi:hypothetical protein